MAPANLFRSSSSTAAIRACFARAATGARFISSWDTTRTMSTGELRSNSAAQSIDLKAAMPASSPLTHEEKAKYDRDGFVVIRGLYDLNKIDAFKRHFQKICAGEVDHGTMKVTRDVKERMDTSVGERAITKIKDFQNDPVFFQYCMDQAALSYVTNFTGPNVKSVHTMLINKPPDPGSISTRDPPRLYQSLYYFPFRPANKIVCSWTAMEKADRQNGCLVVIPGSHKQPKLAHGHSPWDKDAHSTHGSFTDMSQRIWLSGSSAWKQSSSEARWRIHLVMEPGDTVFFHPLLMHGSGSSRTNQFRKAIACYYASADCHFIDVVGKMQEDITAEWVLAKHKVGTESYQDFWRDKSKLVCGEEASTS